MSFLKPYHKDVEDPSRRELRRPPTAVVTAFDKDVDYILADRVVSRRGVPSYHEYLVNWKNLLESEATWECEDDLWQFDEDAVSLGGGECYGPPKLLAQFAHQEPKTRPIVLAWPNSGNF